MAAKRQIERRTEGRIHIDLRVKHLRALGRIRMALGRWGNPATMSQAVRIALEMLDEQFHPHLKKSKDEPQTEAEHEPGVTSGLL